MNKILYQKKWLLMTLFVTKYFFVSTTTSRENLIFLFSKVQKFLTFSQLGKADNFFLEIFVCGALGALSMQQALFLKIF